MHRYWWLGMLALALTAGCSSASPGGSPDPGSQGDYEYQMGFLPFVEEVSLPQDLYANEDFNVTLRLSSTLRPNVLRGLDPLEGRMRNSFGSLAHGDELFVGWEVTPWQFGEGSPAEDVNDTIRVRLRGLPEGDWFIGVLSAKDREHGGLSENVQVMPSFDWQTTDAVVQEVPIHVLAARTQT